MKHFELNGQIREIGNKAVIKATRKQGLVPCNLYGLGMENVVFTVNAKELNGLISNPASFIVDIKLNDGRTFTAVPHEYQFHPVQDNCLHVDFLAVDEVKPIVIEIPIKISGHAVGVQAGGKFTKLMRKLKVKALMNNLPDELNIDITDLQIGKSIVAGDLNFENLTILNQKSAIICSVAATRQSSK